VDADQHTADRQRHGGEEHGERAGAEVRQQHGGDREGRGRVIAREARIAGVREEGVDVRVGGERTRAIDQPGDDRRDGQPAAGGQQRQRGGDREPVAVEHQPGDEQQQHPRREERLGRPGIPARKVLDAVVMGRERVGVLGERQIAVGERHHAILAVGS
jgi:hypothetical protein